jgi:hypothetical protein
LCSGLQGTRQAWYFVESQSKLGDLYNILHLPYTAMLLAFVVIGAAVSPGFHLDRLAATIAAYFLGLGIGAHAIDQLEPGGSHYVKKMGSKELVGLAAIGLVGGTAIGFYYALSLTLWLVPFILVNLFFAIAYPLPSRVAGGLFHNNLNFAFAWGFLPFITSYFVNSLALTFTGLILGLPAAAVAWSEIHLSRRSRLARKESLPSANQGGLETVLKLLVLSTCSVALLLLVGRLALG